ncbi:MAG: hypothetical protein IKK78_01295, partial [Oscillospiraceae bacterium]|nr:hypothetical protein [Oscillospiraceae bacterium]
TLPEDMIFTCEGESAISALDSRTGSTATYTLAMGEGIDSLAVGAIVPASLSGRLYVDADENGLEGESESGLSGAMMTLMQGGTVISACETAADGSYVFGAVRPGEYRVRATLPGDALFARDGSLRLAHPDAVEGETNAFELAMGEEKRLESVGTVRAATIGGRAWSDDNADGRMDAEEPALSGTMAELLSIDDQGNAAMVSAAEVDGNGEYAFRLLRSGTYAVRFTLPQDRLFADDLGEEDTSSVAVVPGNVGMTAHMTLDMGEKRTTVNVGGILPGSIGDTIWLDENGNGLQDYREPLIPNVPLNLMKAGGDGSMELIAETVSDAYGYYRFRDLRPGAYVVRIGLEDGDVLTYSFGAPLGEIDSDFDQESGETDLIMLMSGQTLRNVDAGFADKMD